MFRKGHNIIYIIIYFRLKNKNLMHHILYSHFNHLSIKFYYFFSVFFMFDNNI